MKRALLCLWLLTFVAAFGAQTTVWSKRPVHFVGLGDSLTEGVGASKGQSYFLQLEARLKPVFPRLKAENIALSGANSGGLERRLKRLKPAGRDTLGWVVITIGGNDLVHGFGILPPKEFAMYGATMEQARPWIAAFAPRLERIVREVKGRFPGGCEIFVANIYDPTDDRGDIENAPGVQLPPWPDARQIFEAYNKTLAAVPGIHAVDIHGPFLGHGFHHGSNPGWFFDLEHPNDLGHTAVAHAFWEAMVKVAPSVR